MYPLPLVERDCCEMAIFSRVAAVYEHGRGVVLMAEGGLCSSWDVDGGEDFSF
jgi:hypothetical protein